jgi:hypothetical protein
MLLTFIGLLIFSVGSVLPVHCPGPKLVNALKVPNGPCQRSQRSEKVLTTLSCRLFSEDPCVPTVTGKLPIASPGFDGAHRSPSSLIWPPDSDFLRTPNPQI